MNTISDARTAAGRSVVKRQPVLVLVAADHLLEARLVDRHLAGLERGDLRRVLVDADDGVPVFGEAGAQHETDVPGSDDSDFHFTIRY